MTVKSFDRVASIYDETRGLPPDASQRIGDGLTGILRALSPHPHVLEVGIGTGRIAVLLAERGIRVTGIDVAPQMLAQLHSKRQDLGVVLAEATQLPFHARPFDAALFIHVLHLVPSPEAVLRSVLAVVRPGGMLIHGADDLNPGVYRDVAAVVEQAAREIAGVQLRGRATHEDVWREVEHALAAAGAACRRIRLAEWRSPITGAMILAALRGRFFSQTWAIPDAHLYAIIDRVTPAITRLCGDLDRVHEISRSLSVLIGQLPR